MNILWAGAEDIDFPVIGSATVVTTAGRFRSGWSRCAINQAKNGLAYAKSAAFTGGAVTTAWLSWQWSTFDNSSSNCGGLAFGLSGGTKSLGVGTTGTLGQLCIYKYDGTTRTILVQESGSNASLTNSTIQRFDFSVSNYGVSATATLYLNGVSLLTFTGDVTVSGMTNFDSVFAPPLTNTGGSANFGYSEIFVADSDTRAVQGLQTLALTGAGTTNSWSNNTFSNINGTSFSDANPTFSNTAAQDQQYTVTTPTPVTYSVIAVTQSARLARPATATTTQVKLGYKNGATGSFGTGATKTPGVGFSLFTQIDAINPVTGVAFTQSDLASLQLDMQSA